MARSDLNVSLGIIIKDFEKGLRKAERSLRRTAFKFQSIGQDLTASVSLPIAGVGVAALKAGADFEKLELAFSAVADSSVDVRKEIQALQKVAQSPGLGFEQAIQASTRLQAVGLNADQARSTIAAYGNAVARSGGGAREFEGAITALVQVASKGKISAEEINQLNERIFEIRPALESAFGTSDSEELQKLGISSEEFIARTTKAFAELEQVQGGLGNSFENAGIALRTFLADLGRQINELFNVQQAVERLSEFLNRLSEQFKALTPEQQKSIIRFAAIAAAIGPVLIVMGKLISIARLAVLAIQTLLVPISTVTKVFIGVRAAALAAGGGIQGLAIAARALVAPLLVIAVKILAVVAALTAIVGAFLFVRRNSEAFKDFFLNIWTKIKIGVARRINGLIDAIKPVFKQLGIEIENVREPFDQLITEPARFETFKEFISGVSSDVKNLAPGLVNAVSGFNKLRKSLFGSGEGESVTDQAAGQIDTSAFADTFTRTGGGGTGTAGTAASLTDVTEAANAATLATQNYATVAQSAANASLELGNATNSIIAGFQGIDAESAIANQVLTDVGAQLEQVQLRADVLGLDSAGDQVSTLAEKIRILKDALVESAGEFENNRLISEQLREQLTPLQEQYDGLIAQQERQQEVLGVVNSAIAQGASVAKDAAKDQKTAFEAIGLAAVAAAAKVVKAELQKAVALYIADSLAKLGIGGLILAAGAGAIVGAVFQQAIGALGVPGLAEGGIIPPGFPNDTFPARLTSGEAVIPLDRLENMIDRNGTKVGVTGQFVLRGNDLVAAVERGQYNQNRGL